MTLYSLTIDTACISALLKLLCQKSLERQLKQLVNHGFGPNLKDIFEVLKIRITNYSFSQKTSIILLTIVIYQVIKTVAQLYECNVSIWVWTNICYFRVKMFNWVTFCMWQHTNKLTLNIRRFLEKFKHKTKIQKLVYIYCT